MSKKRKKKRQRGGVYQRPDRPGWWAKIGGAWWHATSDDEAEANRELKDVRQAAKDVDAALSGDGPPTVGDALVAFKAHIETNRPTEFSWYDGKLNEFFDVVDPDMPLEQLTPMHVLDWINKRKGSPTTRHNCGRAVRDAIGWYYFNRRLGTSPLKGIQLPSPATKDYVYPGWAGLLAIAFADRYRYGAKTLPEFLALVIFTGARPSELCRARGHHVDPDGSMIRLPTGKQRRGSKPGARTIPIPKGMWPMVKRLKESARANGLLLPNRYGKQRTPNAWVQSWIRIRKWMGLPQQATIYQWRHTWITNAVIAGVPLGIVAQATGTSIEMISRKYSHLEKGALDAWKEKL